ncbi:lipoprotein LpqH [Mycobacterium sp.]|uniref:lipoprotein LpqH n=1 Tax=Mycobacterium sp. TaxID=1785 RepID=UPI003C78528A
MQNRIAVAAAAALVVAGLAACSSDKQPSHPSQASVTINGNTVANQQAVTCNQEQWYWTIAIGDQKVSGVKALVNKTDDKFTAQSVHIVNLGGFTGTYAKGDGEDASASFSSETFTLTGTAKGFNTYTPNESATATFKIVATC